jgi:hypothetical protein
MHNTLKYALAKIPAKILKPSSLTESFKTPKWHSHKGLPAFIKGIKADINAMKGITPSDLFSINVTGILEKRIKITCRKPYIVKARKETDGLRTTRKTKAKKTITLILGSREWIKLRRWLYSSR